MIANRNFSCEIWAEHGHDVATVDFASFKERLLARLYERFRARNSAELARGLGLHKATLHRVENSPGMSAEMLFKLCDAAGLQIASIFPEEKPAPEEASLSVIGSVSAGSGVADYDEPGAPRDEYDAIIGPLKASKRWKLGKGEAFLLELSGDSMEPEYPDGCHLVVRMVADATKVPEGTPVIFRERDTNDSYFKIFQEGRRDSNGRLREIIGKPLNRSHDVLVWSPRDAAITHVVMGMVK